MLLRRLDQALGIEDEPITPRLPLPEALVEQCFPEPIARQEDVLGTIERLAARLGAVLESRGEGARLLQTALFRSDGKVFRIEAGTAEPLREPKRVARLFADRLDVIGDECDPGFGFDVVRLSALVTERSDPQQTGLASEDHAEELAHLIDRLGARFGLRRVTRQMPEDTHIPEFAVTAVAAHMTRSVGFSAHSRASGNPGPRTGSPAEVYPRLDRGRGRAVDIDDSPAPTRPIRLFTRPEPIEAVAEVPDGPPVRFRWRQVLHEVARTEGPERIAMEWWRDENKTRDYFRVECREGMRVWLYREGLFDAQHPPRWFVHGVFA
jgi:protein ImuB